MTNDSARQAITDCRERIDAVDRRLLALLNERARIAEQIGRFKRESDLPIVEPAREEAVIQNVREHNTGPLSADAVRRVFEAIVSEMRAVQRDLLQSGEGAPRTE
jgi:chorismate mutase-like protein